MNTKRAKEILEEMASRFVVCEDCEGLGIDKEDPESSCSYCGGIGEIMEGWFIDIGGIREALEGE